MEDSIHVTKLKIFSDDILKNVLSIINVGGEFIRYDNLTFLKQELHNMLSNDMLSHELNHVVKEVKRYDTFNSSKSIVYGIELSSVLVVISYNHVFKHLTLSIKSFDDRTNVTNRYSIDTNDDDTVIHTDSTIDDISNLSMTISTKSA